MKNIIRIVFLVGLSIILPIQTLAKTNQLINSSSPYLLQHAHNPVDWYPWGEEAFAQARRQNKPILISIGYSTCYWCHVMEREVFENPEIAKLMNASLICIKVDREQRPDVDEIYMTATQLLTQAGGWPNNVFVTPDLKPFYAGTYFPAHDTRYGPGFVTVVGRIHDAWKEDQAGLEEQASRLTAAIVAIKEGDTFENVPHVRLDRSLVQKLIQHYRDNFDERYGGFYQAPKFPNENALLFLLDAAQVDNNTEAQSIARITLLKMAEGGFHDHVGGGFHRYATDATWSIPHFEKMLYNQALLGRAYTELYRQSPSPSVRLFAESTFDFVLQQLALDNGGFASALDAETDAVEGDYYTYNQNELRAALDPQAYAWLMNNFGLADIPKIMGHKNSEGRVLYLKRSLSDIAKTENVSEEHVVLQYQNVMARLLARRNQRKRPREDDKIITSWNGLMIEALADAGEVFQKPSYIDAAVRAAHFILDRMQKKDGTLWRIAWHDTMEINGTFEDYAFLIRGLAALYRVTHQAEYLTAIQRLMDTSQSLFWDTNHGGYFYTSGKDDLLVRMKNAEDSAIPSGNAIMAEAMLDLYSVTHDEGYRKKAEAILQAFAPALTRNPREYTTMVDALLRMTLDLPGTTSDTGHVVDPTPVQSMTETQSKVAVRIVNINRDAQRVSLSVEIEVEKDWHINASHTNLDAFIPTSLDVRGDENSITIDKILYPTPSTLETPLGSMNVYQGLIKIPVQITLGKKDPHPRLLVRAQACKDTLCLRPSDWVLPFKID